MGFFMAGCFGFVSGQARGFSGIKFEDGGLAAQAGGRVRDHRTAGRKFASKTRRDPLGSARSRRSSAIRFSSPSVARGNRKIKASAWAYRAQIGVVGGKFYPRSDIRDDVEAGVAIVSDGDAHMAGGRMVQSRDAGCGQAPVGAASQQFVAQHVATDGGNNPRFHAVPVQVIGGVERRTAEKKSVRQKVPKDFTEAEGERA